LLVPLFMFGSMSEAQLDQMPKAKMFEDEKDRIQALFNTKITGDTPLQPSFTALDSVKLTFKDVGFSIPKADGSTTTILEPVSGCMQSGSLVALMGPSGCGKSTLLDMLAMKKTATYTGEILINGHPRDHLFQRIAAYVSQEDVMPEYWTVKEAVEFNMDLKSMGSRHLKSIGALDVLMSAFGLSEIANTYIGGPKVRGCSGGQRRRVTLLRGMAQGARIIFCDEPTSGLSATDAELCIKALRVMAKCFNLLIVVVIHQPRVEVADLFDDLILLTSRPGRMIYSGPMRGALAYWEECGHPVPKYANPTDIYLDMITPGGPMDRVDEFMQHFTTKLKDDIDVLVAKQMHEKHLAIAESLQHNYDFLVKQGMKLRPLRLSSQASSLPRQIQILLRNKVKLKARNPSALMATLVVPVIMGVITGLFYQGTGSKSFQAQASFLFSLMLQVALGGNQMMPLLMEERKIMKYDISEKLYSAQAFIMVSLIIDVFLAMIGALLKVLLMFAISGVHWDYFGPILGWCTVVFVFFDSLFAFLASFCADIQTATVLSSPILVIFIYFSGFILNPVTAPSWLTWVFTISPINYALQDIMYIMAPDYKEGTAICISMGYKSGQAGQGLAIIFSLAIVFRLAQVACLMYRHNIQK
jgi:ABC-type multidrug transport system ATPase subunit/ABC-type multidrug transport system permease subunit